MDYDYRSKCYELVKAKFRCSNILSLRLKYKYNVILKFSETQNFCVWVVENNLLDKSFEEIIILWKLSLEN